MWGTDVAAVVARFGERRHGRVIENHLPNTVDHRLLRQRQQPLVPAGQRGRGHAGCGAEVLRVPQPGERIDQLGEGHHSGHPVPLDEPGTVAAPLRPPHRIGHQPTQHIHRRHDLGGSLFRQHDPIRNSKIHRQGLRNHRHATHPVGQPTKARRTARADTQIGVQRTQLRDARQLPVGVAGLRGVEPVHDMPNGSAHVDGGRRAEINTPWSARPATSASAGAHGNAGNAAAILSTNSAHGSGSGGE